MGKNIIVDDELKWLCVLWVFWIDIFLFVELVRGLLFYGIFIIVVLGLIFNVIFFVVLIWKYMRKFIINMYLFVLVVYDCFFLILNFMIGVFCG